MPDTSTASRPVLLLLVAGVDGDVDRAAALDALVALPGVTRAAHHRRVAQDPFDTAQARPAPWQVAVEVELADGGEPSDDVLDALRPFTAGADLARSAAVAGRGDDLIPGEGRVRLLYCMRRRSDLTLEAFHDYWANVHAAIASSDPTRGRRTYRQLHADVERSARLAHALGLGGGSYDGVTISAMDALADLPLVADRGDRVNFVDAETETGLFVELTAERAR